MSRTPPQAYDEMVETALARKEGRIYKKDEADAYTDDRISQIVSGTLQELADIAKTSSVLNLSDLQTVKERTLIYMKACEQSATIPTMSGLARSFGMSTQALNNHMNRNPNSSTTEWLRVCHDAFADAMAESASRGLTNVIFSIFSLKARSGWRDNVSIEVTQNNDPLGGPVDVEEKKKKYEHYFDYLPEE